jgi:hypothetical protein
MQLGISVQDAARDDYQIDWAVARDGLRRGTNRLFLCDVDEVMMDISPALLR